MLKHFRITVDGRSYNVSVEDLNPEAAESQKPAHPAATTSAAVPSTPKPVALAAEVPGAITAPLSGAVLQIDVAPGRNVAAGERVAVLEAMKMKVDVVAKLNGRVARVEVAPNQSVETGQVLMTLE